MKKWLPLALAAMVLLMTSCALGEGLPVREYDFSGEMKQTYDTETLKYSIEMFYYEEARCYVSKIWMADPGRQIKKATAKWEKNLMYPSEMGKKVEGAALVINGSGYVSPVFPDIPENYPGKSKDYFYTPLGSLTITNGEIFRNLEGVPFYGLTLQEDGLHMHVGEDNEEVLAQNPTQTWSFYERCPMILNHESILDTEWKFANNKAIRTIIAKMDDNNYIILTVTHKTSAGLTLVQCVDFLLEHFNPQWAYDLDGGPSSALLYRNVGKKSLKTLYGNNSKDADIMAFVE